MNATGLAIVALVVTAAAAFLLGSIPFGYVIGRFFYRTDIRTQGSGNIGAMNALRTLGKTGAAPVLLLDAAKGFVPVFFAQKVIHGSLIFNRPAAPYRWTSERSPHRSWRSSPSSDTVSRRGSVGKAARASPPRSARSSR